MGWAMFRAHLREMHADHERRSKTQTTSPESWRGAEHDDFWPSSRGR
jgi:hypothetical protein